MPVTALRGFPWRLRAAAISLALVVAALGVSGVAAAQDATFEVTEETLNNLLRRLGSPADAGVYQSAAGPLTWRWWVTGARFQVTAGSMAFTATVHWRVVDQANSQTRTVPASVAFDGAGNRLRIAIGAFTVPVQSDGTVVTQVDVARLFGISVPVEPQELAVPLLDGGTREIPVRAESVTSQYLPGRLLTRFDVSLTAPPTPHLLGARAPGGTMEIPPVATLASTGRGTVRVYESLLNKIASRLEPLRMNGRYHFEAGCTCVPLVGCGCVVSVTCDWTARVNDLNLSIRPARIRITGNLHATWCDIPFSAPVETTADVEYVTRMAPVGGPRGGWGTKDLVRVRVNPTSIQPRFTISGYVAKLPIHINVAPSFSWRLPVDTALLAFENAGGVQRLRLSPTQVSLIKRNGYLEMQAQVGLW
jgi:hypothetical protein